MFLESTRSSAMQYHSIRFWLLYALTILLIIHIQYICLHKTSGFMPPAQLLQILYELAPSWNADKHPKKCTIAPHSTGPTKRSLAFRLVMACPMKSLPRCESFISARALRMTITKMVRSNYEDWHCPETRASCMQLLCLSNLEKSAGMQYSRRTFSLPACNRA